MNELLRRTDLLLRPDPGRVLARLFVPGHERLDDRGSRSSGVLTRILATSEPDAASTLAEVRTRFSARHRDFDAVIAANFAHIAHRVPEVELVSDAHRGLIGATFSSEYALEAAALFNPSVVPHPDQTDVGAGELRFVMSLRAVGEGHLSSVEFRTGVIDGSGEPRLDPPGPFASVGETKPAMLHRDQFALQLTEQGADAESSSYLLGVLPQAFDGDVLDAALQRLAGQQVTRHGAEHTATVARRLVQESYETVFDASVPLAERVLWPRSASEARGIEDARFVRFTETGGAVDYRATCTGFDGDGISQRLVTTTDFRRFTAGPLTGSAARDKGMALFPRPVGGAYLALSRWDRERIAIATSPDGRRWNEAVTLELPTAMWQLVQTGNCGSPIETPAGWLLLTHGVGPLREYAVGAVLVDLADPTRVLGSLPSPLLRASPDERDGYVPNVVYSCGSVVHGEHLVLPYGASDTAVRCAVVDLPALLDRLTG